MAAADQNPATAFLNSFKLSVSDLITVSDLLIKDMQEGLSKEEHGSPIKMLVTFVHRLPSGSEKGQYLAIDLGGSNFRVLLVTIGDKGSIEQVAEKYALDENVSLFVC